MWVSIYLKIRRHVQRYVSFKYYNGSLELQSPDPTQAQELLTILTPVQFSDMQSTVTFTTNEKHTEYDNLGQPALQSNVNYYYDNPSHIYPTRIITNNSKGQQLTTYLKYPLDYTLGQTLSLDNMNTSFKAGIGVAMNDMSNCLGAEQTALQPYQPFHGNTASNQSAFTTIANQYNCQATFRTDVTTATQNRDAAWNNYLLFINNSISTNTVAWQKGVLFMQANNIISPVIEKYSTQNQSDGNDYLLSATRNEYNILNNPVGVPAVFPSAISQVELTTPLLLSTFTANTDAYYKPQVSFGYDRYRNLAVQNKTLDKKMAYLWDYSNAYPIAQVTNADVSNVAYTSFEADGMGNWQFNNGAVTGGFSVTGLRNYTLGGANSITSSALAVGNYTITYWLKNGSPNLTINGATANVSVSKNGWTLYTRTINGINSVSISGTGIIDELRLYPADAQMVTYTYTPLAGISSTCDATNHIVYNVYDGLGRLTAIQDQDYNVVKSYSYTYASTPSCGTNYTNQQPHSGTYTKNDCGTGYVGSAVTYYVPVGKWSSTSSQTDAEQKAGTDVTTNGQAYTNLNGTCTLYVCGPSNCNNGYNIKCVNNVCETANRSNVSSVWIKTIPPGSPPNSVASFYWKCTWHFQWSDGSVGTDYYEYNSTSCPLGCVGCTIIVN